MVVKSSQSVITSEGIITLCYFKNTRVRNDKFLKKCYVLYTPSKESGTILGKSPKSLKL